MAGMYSGGKKGLAGAEKSPAKASANKTPKMGKLKGISTPFHNRIASVGGKR